MQRVDAAAGENARTFQRRQREERGLCGGRQVEDGRTPQVVESERVVIFGAAGGEDALVVFGGGGHSGGGGGQRRRRADTRVRVPAITASITVNHTLSIAMVSILRCKMPVRQPISVHTKLQRCLNSTPRWSAHLVLPASQEYPRRPSPSRCPASCGARSSPPLSVSTPLPCPAPLPHPVLFPSSDPPHAP